MVHNVVAVQSLRKLPIVAVALVMLASALILPPSHIVSPADATATPTSTKFGMSGARIWNNYNLATVTAVGEAGPSGACGCEPTMGVDWVHGNGKDAIYQAMTETFCLSWDDNQPIGVPPQLTMTRCTSQFNNYGATYGGGAVQPNYDPILYTDFDGGRTFAGGLVINPPPPANPVTPIVCGVLPYPAGCTYGCSELSFTDTNDGSDGWMPVTDACALPSWDHETISGGPWAFPPPSWAAPGSRAVYYCAQVGEIACWTSYDGGVTFSPTNLANDPSNDDCTGIHGHMRIGRMYKGDDVGESGSDPQDGLGYAYLPDKACSIGSAAAAAASTPPTPPACKVNPGNLPCKTGFVYSKDNALSFIERERPDTSSTDCSTNPPPAGPILRPGHMDPSIAPSLDNGWIYLGAGEQGATAGQPGGAYIAMSKTNGATWEDVGVGNGACPGTKYFNVGALAGVQQATMADVMVGDDDRAAFAFLGSTASTADYDSCGGGASAHIFNLYVALTYDAGKTWTVDKVTTDPVQRGGIWPYGGGATCRNLLDFNDIVTDYQGRIMMAYSDGCVGTCAGPTGTSGMSTSADAAVARQTTGRGLLKAYDIPDPPPTPLPDDSSSPSSAGPVQYQPYGPEVTDTNDQDGDGVIDANDDCKTVPNADQKDTDMDSFGDACDADDDGDGILDGADNCQFVPNAQQLDANHNKLGDVCDADADGDGKLNAADDCWLMPNADQVDLDRDGIGDVCDKDRDGDGVPDSSDAYPDDQSRWNGDLVDAAGAPQTIGEDHRPMNGVEAKTAGSTSSMPVLMIAGALVIASMLALMLLMLRRK
ncbi:MAG: thrombospondin type 3 repeat-containing protein [bacterium]